MRRLILISLLIISGCSQINPTGCTEDARVCPDGSVVVRDPNNNCEFDPCPEECSTDSDCGTGGCSSQICSTKENAEDIITTCEYKEEYDCLQKTSCSCIEGKCGFEQNQEYLNCLSEFN